MQDMMNAINEYFNFVNSTDIGPSVFFGFIALAVFVIALRIIISVAYRIQQSLVNVNAKPIPNRAGIKDTHSQMLNRIIKDYMRLGEKGVTLNSSRNIVEKHVLKMNFLTINLRALETFVNSFEQMEIYIGIVLMIIFESYRLPFAVGTLALFLLMRIFSVFFDFNVNKTRIIQDTTEYIDREIGQFFIGDISSLFIKFRNEISNSIHKQTEGLSESINRMGDNISGVMRLNSNEVSKTVDISAEKLNASINEINNALADWKRVIELSEKAEMGINEAVKNLNASTSDFTGSSAKMADVYERFATGMEESNKSIGDRITELKENSKSLQKFSEPIITANASLKTQLDYIERNQTMLETSIQKYEVSMQEITAHIGEALGSIVEYHIQNSYNSMNDRLEENIKQIVGGNNNLIMRLQGLFDEMRQLSRSETQAIIKIKEQMDIHFDNLSEKMFTEQPASKPSADTL